MDKKRETFAEYVKREHPEIYKEYKEHRLGKRRAYIREYMKLRYNPVNQNKQAQD